MGGCTGKSSKKGEKQGYQFIRIGGEENGKCQWIIEKGEKKENPQASTGWEMKFKVDENCQVSSGNKENKEDEQKKDYKGKFENGVMDVIARYPDGGQIKHEGKIENGIMKIKCEVLETGSENRFMKGDVALCEGMVKYE